MHDRHVLEVRLEVRDDLTRQSNFGHKNQHAPTKPTGYLRQLDVNLRLAGTRHAVQKEAAEPARRQNFFDRRNCRDLLVGQLERFGHGFNLRVAVA